MRSMTGYGAGSAEDGPSRVLVEIRSVNGRFGEVRLRIPQEIAPYEADLRRQVIERVRRGKVEVTISIESETSPPVRVRVNHSLARQYLDAVDQLRRGYAFEGSVSIQDMLAVPGLIEVEKAADGPAHSSLLEAIERAVGSALDAHDSVRRSEGKRMALDLDARLVEIERLRAEIVARADTVPQTIRQKLAERIRRLAPEATLEAGRLEQEVALLADRSDITEELVRLEAHIKAGREILIGEDEPAGKRLEFLLQEIGRETNTIGSKSIDIEITRRALAIKAEAEKLREQVQNLE